jgi:hypothetical protein
MRINALTVKSLLQAEKAKPLKPAWKKVGIGASKLN